MPVSRDEVRRIAELARLGLTDEEAGLYAAQLSDILEHVEALESADTTAVSAGESAPATPLRGDEPPADRLASQPAEFAPAFDEGFFTVPRLAAMESDTEEPTP